MNKFNNGLKFNLLGSVKYNSQILRSLRQIYTRIGIRPIVLDQEQNALAVLENSFDIELEQEVNDMDELIFSIPFTDEKKEFIVNENLIQMYETLYIIREIRMKKGSSTPSLEVFCEALWYDLQFADPIETTSWVDANAATVISDLIRGTGWSLGVVEIQTKRTLELNKEESNPLKGINIARSIFGGDLKFDTVNKRVNLLEPEAKHSGASIVYQKNMQEIEASYDTRNLITRLYVYGANNLTIEAANNGLKYIENYQYMKKRRVRTLKNEAFSNPYYLRDWAEKELEILSRPISSYRITAQDLSTLSGLSHEKFSIGCIVRVYDKELKLDENTRIMKWTYNIAEPWRTKIELETTTKSLSDLLSSGNLGNAGFSSADSLNDQQIIDLMVFNYLLNSRADDGFNYWTNSGWEVDPLNGYAGPASFKAEGNPTGTKEMKQTICPSHRDAYSLSFRAYSENLRKQTGGRVGINVKITYDDGHVEDQFIPLA